MGLLIYCFVIYCLGGMGASLVYHRILTHRVAELKPWFRKIAIVLALPAGTPVQWVGTHRQHHQFADKVGDPHSPVIDGFWYAHCGWYLGTKNRLLCVLYAFSGVFRLFIDAFLRPRSNQQYNHKALDIQQDPFCAFLSNKYVYQWAMLSYGSFLIVFPYFVFGKSGIFATWLTLAIVYNLGDSINSFAHLYGTKSSADNQSRNHALLAYITFGEGFHANHHQKANLVNMGKNNGTPDFGYLVLRALGRLGLLKIKAKSANIKTK